MLLTTRSSSRAPYSAVNPFLSNSSRASSDTVSSTFFAASLSAKRRSDLSSISSAMWRSMSWKTMVSVRRLRNSGLKVFFTCVSIASPLDTVPPNPMLALEAYCAPALDVMMMITSWKSARCPRLSVSEA